jgi:hypothetical protein
MENLQIDALGQNLRSRLIQRHDPEYAASRKLYNGMIDKQST